MRYHVRLIATTAAGVLLLTACGPSTETTGQPVAGGTLTIAIKDDLKTLDPAVAYDTTGWSVERSIFNGLLDYKGFTTELVPDIAEAMPDITNGGKTYTFKIRKGVKFSNGREVTADDFKYSWERMLNPKTQGPMTGGPFWASVSGTADFYSGKSDHISGIKVVDPYTLEVDLDTPNQSFLNIIAMPFGFGRFQKGGVAAAAPTRTQACRAPAIRNSTSGPPASCWCSRRTPTTSARRRTWPRSISRSASRPSRLPADGEWPGGPGPAGHDHSLGASTSS